MRLQARALETASLIIRPLVVEDCQAMHRYTRDPAVMAWLPEGVMTEAETEAFATRHALVDPTAWAVISLSSQTLIGHLVFHPWAGPHTYEIGWVFAQEHHGRGYATEAARALLSHAFKTLGLHRVIATCQPENPASWRVMEKLGMRREGYFRQCIARDSGIWWDEYFYATLADEWR